jgi:hypothetical protein
VIITRIVANADGESRFDDVELEMTAAIVADGVPPMHMSGPLPVTAAFFVEQPAGATDWRAHVAPRRQLVLVISGRVAVETTDGVRREFGPGEFVLAEDTTGRGHLTIPLTGDIRLLIAPLAG